MTFAAVYIPEFPVAAWRLSAPELRSSPCAVVEGIPPQERVVSCCARARARGIAPGMSRVQAEAGTGALFRARYPGQEQASFSLALEIAERFSPRVEALASPRNRYAEAHPPAALLLLDSSGTGTLFGSPGRHAKALHQAMLQAGFAAGVGAAPNAEAALLLARSGAGVACASQDELAGRLAGLPVSLLAGGQKLQATLRRWGIRTLGELAALPETALISRLGQQGKRLQQLARGEAEHLLVPEEPGFTLAETMALDSPVDLLDSLLFVLSPMLEAVLRRAMDRAYAVRSVRLTLALERAAPHRITIRPATPTQNREVLLKLLNLELQAHPPQAGIVGVTLEAEPAQPPRAQWGLFQAQFPEPDRLELLLARLRAIAGQDNAGAPQLQNRHGDDAFTLVPFQPSLGASLNQEPEPSQKPDQDPDHEPDQEPGCDSIPARLAIRIFRPPQPVRVTCHGDQPRAMSWQGTRQIITAAAGPWHSSGSWWDDQAWDHDLWDVVTAEPAQALRLRQDHASRQWSVVGLYD